MAQETSQALAPAAYQPRNDSTLTLNTIFSPEQAGSVPLSVVCSSGATFWLLLSSQQVVRYDQSKKITFTAGCEGRSGFLDGEASKSLFSLQTLSAACLDAHGALIVSDTGNNRIRSVNTNTSSVSTIAGSDKGCLDGSVATAKFSSPSSIALTSLGHFMLCDTGNNRIRLVADNMVYTVAGCGLQGHSDGPSLESQFNAPSGVQVTADNVILVADTDNHMIRYISDSEVITIAGNGTPGLIDGTLGHEVALSSPTRLTWTQTGDLIILDRDNNALRKMGTDSTLTTIIGGSSSAPNPEFSNYAALSMPTALDTSENGSLYIIDKNGLHIAAWKDQAQLEKEAQEKKAKELPTIVQPEIIPAPSHLLGNKRHSATGEAPLFGRPPSLLLQSPPQLSSPPSPTSQEELATSVSLDHLSKQEPLQQYTPDSAINPQRAAVKTDEVAPLPTSFGGDQGRERSASVPYNVDTNFITMDISDVYDSADDPEISQSAQASNSNTLSITPRPSDALTPRSSDASTPQTTPKINQRQLQPLTPRSSDPVPISSSNLGHWNSQTTLSRKTAPSLPIPSRVTTIDGNFLASAVISPEAADIFDCVDTLLSTCAHAANRNHVVDADTNAKLKTTGKQIVRNFSVMLRRYQDCVQSCTLETFLDQLMSSVQPVMNNILALGPALSAVEAVHQQLSKSPPAALHQLSLLGSDIKDGISVLEKTMSSRPDDDNSVSMQVSLSSSDSLPPLSARPMSMLVTSSDTSSVSLIPQAELEKSGKVARWAPIRRCCGLFSNPTKGVVWATTTDHLVVRFEESGTMTVLAGLSGVGGYVNGASEKAQFRFLRLCGLVEDRNGGLILVDSGNHCLRYLNPAGTRVTDHAGDARRPGFKDGPLDASRFNTPSSVVLSPHGELFVSDTGNNRIRMISNGIVSTFGGSGQRGAEDGIFLDASFRSPSGLCLTPDGDLYVADYHNHLIRKISGGFVTTVAGDGTEGHKDGEANEAQFSNPTSLTIVGEGDIIVSDYYNHCLRLISDGKVTTFAGTPKIPGTKSGFGLDSTFTFPNELVLLPPLRMPEVKLAEAVGDAVTKQGEDSNTVSPISSPPLSPRTAPGGLPPISLANIPSGSVASAMVHPVPSTSRVILNSDSRALAAAAKRHSSGPNALTLFDSDPSSPYSSSPSKNSADYSVRLLVADTNSIRVVSDFPLPKHIVKADMGLSLVQMSWEQGHRYQPQQWIIDAITALHSTGRSIRDLWTLSSEVNLVRPIVEKLLSGQSIDWYALAPRVTATIIKSFFQKLPVPLLTMELQDVFIAASQPIYDSTDSRRIDLIHQAVKSLPVANRILLKHLINLFASFGDTAQIPAVWGPILLLRRSLGIFRDAIKASSRVLGALIEFNKQLFGDLDLIRHSSPPDWLNRINRSEQVQESFGPYIRSLMMTHDRLSKVKEKVDITELFDSVNLMRDLLFALQEQFLNTPVCHVIERYHLYRFHAYVTSFQDAWVKLDDPNLTTTLQGGQNSGISPLSNNTLNYGAPRATTSAASDNSSNAKSNISTFPGDSIIAQRLNSATLSSPIVRRYGTTTPPGKPAGLPYQRTTMTGAGALSSATTTPSGSPVRPLAPIHAKVSESKETSALQPFSLSNSVTRNTSPTRYRDPSSIAARAAENTLSDSASDSELDYEFLTPLPGDNDYDRWQKETEKRIEAIEASRFANARRFPDEAQHIAEENRVASASTTPEPEKIDGTQQEGGSKITNEEVLIPPLPQIDSDSPILAPVASPSSSTYSPTTARNVGETSYPVDSPRQFIAPQVEGVPSALIAPTAIGVPHSTISSSPWANTSGNDAGVDSEGDQIPFGANPSSAPSSLKSKLSRAELEAREEDNLLASLLRTTRTRNQFDRLVLCALRELVLFAFSVDLSYRGAFFGNPNVVAMLDQARNTLNLVNGRKFWRKSMFDVPVATWRMLRTALSRYVPETMPASWPITLRAALDNHNSGLVSPAHFARFLRAFGPVEKCVSKVMELYEQPWFKGYMTAAEAEHVLCGASKPSFLVRFRSTHPGSFALSYSTTIDPSDVKADFDICHVSIDIVKEPASSSAALDASDSLISNKAASNGSLGSSHSIKNSTDGEWMTKFKISTKHFKTEHLSHSASSSSLRTGSSIFAASAQSANSSLSGITNDDSSESKQENRDEIPTHFSGSRTFASLQLLVEYWQSLQTHKMKEDSYPYNIFEEPFCFGEISEKEAESTLEMEPLGTYLVRLQPRFLIKFKTLAQPDPAAIIAAESENLNREILNDAASPAADESDSTDRSSSSASTAKTNVPKTIAAPGRYWISYIKNPVYAMSATASLPLPPAGPEVAHIELKRDENGHWRIEGASTYATLRELLDANKAIFITPYTQLPSISPIMQDDQDDISVVMRTLLQDEEGEDGYYLDIRSSLSRPVPKSDDAVAGIVGKLQNNRDEPELLEVEALVDYLSKPQTSNDSIERILRPRNRKSTTLFGVIRKDQLRTDTVRLETQYLILNKLCTMTFTLSAGDKPIRWNISDPSSITTNAFFACSPSEGYLAKGESATIKVSVVLFKCVALAKLLRILIFSPGDSQFVTGLLVFVKVTGDILASVLREPKGLSGKREEQEEYWKIPPSSLTDSSLLESSMTANVFRAQLHGAIVAQKRFVLRSKVNDPNTFDLKAFETELAVLLSTRHDNVASFVGAWCDVNASSVYIVLKYAEHGSIAHFLGTNDANTGVFKNSIASANMPASNAGGANASSSAGMSIHARLLMEATPLHPTSSNNAQGPVLRRTSGRLGSSGTANVTAASAHPEETKTFGFKLSLALDAARAVHYMHRHNLLHRDIKSQNMLVDSMYQVQLADFGESRETNTSLMTLGRGTPKYRAPELHTRIYNNKVDIFSLGLVIAELFGAKVTTIPAFVDADKPLLPPMPLGLPGPLLALLKACTLRNPAKRPTAKQVVHLLNLMRKDFLDQGTKRSPRSRFFR